MKLRASAFVFVALLLTACSSSSSNTPSLPNNPSTLTVTVIGTNGSPQAGATVNLSRKLNGEMPAPPILATLTTGASGTATFTGLEPTGPYCVSTTYTSGSTTSSAAGCNSQPIPSTETLTL